MVVVEQLFDIREFSFRQNEVKTYTIHMPARRASGVIWISIERVHGRTPLIGVDVHEVGCLKLLA